MALTNLRLDVLVQCNDVLKLTALLCMRCQQPLASEHRATRRPRPLHNINAGPLRPLVLSLALLGSLSFARSQFSAHACLNVRSGLKYDACVYKQRSAANYCHVMHKKKIATCTDN
eukprot:6184548-Pleurochrysis_carterae.AAC.1